MKSLIMVRLSFSNPFLRSFSRRRSKNDDDSRRRKESMDQTVLSGDSRLNKSVASAEGLLVPCSIYSGQGAGTALSPKLRRASNSEPTLKSSGQAPEPCQCLQCMSSSDRGLHPSYQPQQQQFTPPPMMYTAHNQEVSPPDNIFGRDDPIIQARIEAVEIQQRLLGETHPDVIFALTSLAKLLQKRGDIEGAINIMRESELRSTKVKTMAYEQQLSRMQRQELESLVPSEICIMDDDSFMHNIR